MAPNERPSFLRRKLIIFPRVQVPLIAWSAGLALIGALFTASFVVYNQNHLDADEMQTKLIFSVLALFVFTSYALLLSFYTNRLFGPIYRLQMTMRKVADGNDPGPIRLRDGDHFSEVIDEYNRMREAREQHP